MRSPNPLEWPSPLRQDRGSGHGLPGLPEDPFHTAQTELSGGLPQKVRSRLWPQSHRLPIPSILWRSGTIFGTTCCGLAAVFQESKGNFDFETLRRLFLLWVAHRPYLSQCWKPR